MTMVLAEATMGCQMTMTMKMMKALGLPEGEGHRDWVWAIVPIAPTLMLSVWPEPEVTPVCIATA